jgi:flagellar export protein FliJ
MKSKGNIVRLKQFQVSERRRRLSQIEGMIAEFERMATELDAQIVGEERRSGITDVNHFAYPTFAKAARTRRDNLRNSQADLDAQKLTAQALLDEAEAELSKAEALESRNRTDAEASRAVAAG